MRPEFPPELDPNEIPPEEQHMGATRLARRVFVAFIVTFALARSIVILMSIGRLHDFYLRVGQTHVHHLNYGIFILSGLGAYLIFVRPDSRGLAKAAILYGVGLALTFDEFGMWLHLDDIYWQRRSFDAMVLIMAILGLLMAAPTIRRFHLRHWIWTIVLTAAVGWFSSLMIGPFQRMNKRLAPWFQNQNRRPGAPGVDSTATQPPTAQPPAGPSQRIKK
jgi:uncharacterized ion transporter superfamily protein YfcC